MGVGLLDIGVRFRKFMMFSFRTCYRSVCNHPFLVGFVLFSIFLYRSFPFLFSLLVSTSPVLVCTAVLLGTLLSFGQSNIPEIEKEEERIHEILSLKTGVSRDAVVVERDESFDIERYTDKRRDAVEKSIQEASSASSKVSELDRDDNSFLESSPLIQENSREIQFEKRVIGEEEGELLDSGYEKKSEINTESPRHGEVVENQYSLIHEVRDENVNDENDKSSVEYVNSHMAGDFESSRIPPWRRVEEADQDDEASDYGSDEAESSSPDASMADIIPMLDELHPLLDEDAPQLGHKSHSDSDATSERSQKSSDGINELDADIENQEEEEVGDDDNDDDEEEDTQGGKGDGAKSAITWTEVDQKNLMDLGTSELERNQRLENLIARRRARKDLRMVAEKNLIDLDSSDLPFNIAPISTTRHNPFDLPYDSNDNMGLPPIPGSAPSILLPRRNPFDLPYDSSEEKPDLTEDSFQQEYITFHQKETLFRRHESFNVGPSLFGPHKQEKQGSRLRPYFVPERMAASESTSFSYIQRQSSELSESQVSSIPETESMCSAGGQEVDLISSTDHVYELVKDGSESSEELDTLDFGQSEKRDVEHNEIEIKLGGLEYHHEMESSLSVAGDVATLMEHNTGGIHLNTRAADGSKSSTSLLSEVNGKIFGGKEDEGLSIVEPRKGDLIEESGISTQPSLEESGFNITSGLVDGSQHKEPVYDLSPTAVEKKLPSSSISSELQLELPETGLPALLVKRTIPFADRDSGVSNQSMEKDTPISEGSSHLLHAVDENELELREVTEIGEHDVMNFGFALVDRDVDIANASIVPELVFEHGSTNPKPSSDIKFVEDHFMYQDDNHQREQNQVASSSFDADIHVVVQQDVGEKVDSMDLSSQYKLSGEDQISSSVEQLSVIYPATSSESELIAEHSIDKEVALQFEQDQVHSSSSDANFCVDIHQEADEKLVSSHYQCVPEKSCVLELEKQMSSSNKSMVQLSSDTPGEQQEPLIIQVKSIEEVSTPSNLNVSEIQEPNNKGPSNIYSPLTSDTISFPFEVSETRCATGLADLDDILDRMKNKEQIQVSEHFNYPAEATGSRFDEQIIIEEADKIKEIDEGLLLELDTVGDFSVKEYGSKLNDIENHLVPGGESFLVPRDLETKFDETDHDLIEADKIKAIVEQENPSASRAEKEIDLYRDVEGASEFQLSGASYTEHTSLPVGENFNGEVEIPMDFKSINDGSQQKKTEIELADSAIYRNSILEEINSEIPVVEAQSVEDIDSSFKKNEAMLLKTKIELGESDIPHHDQIEVEINSEMPVLEARSFDDIDSSIKQIGEEKINNPIVTELLHADELTPEETEPGCSEHGESETPHQDQIELEINSEMPVLEARSLEDIDSAFKQIGEENIKEPIVTESLHADELTPEETEPGCSEHGILHEDSNLTESKMELPVIEARSIEDIGLAFKSLHEDRDVERRILPTSVDDNLDVIQSKDAEEMNSEIELGESETPHQGQIELEINSEMPVLEARSLEDINSAFKQIGEEKIKESIVTESLQELTPEETEPGCSEYEILHEDSNLRRNNLELPRSVEDIGLAFRSPHIDRGVERRILPSSVDDNPDVIESKDAEEINSEIELGESEIPHQDQIELEINSEMPVLEARSLGDTNSAFKQIGEEKIKEPIVTESLHAELTTEETEPGCSEHEILHEDSNLTQDNLELPVIEARSIEDIGLAFQNHHEDIDVERHILPSSADDNPDVTESKVPAEINSDLHVAEASSLEDTNMAIKQVPESNLEKPLESDSEDGYARTKANEVGSSKEAESSITEFGMPETSKSIVQTSEVLNLSVSDVEEKKA